MLNKSLVAIVASLMSSTVFAGDWVIGGDYIKQGSLSAIAASGSYVIPMSNSNQKVLVGGRFGVGMGDDNGLKLDSMMGAYGKYQYNIDDQWYVHGVVAYTQFEYSIEVNILGYNYGGSGSDSEFSIGFGGGYQINETSAIELSYENFDYDGALSLGYRYSL